MTGHSLPRNHHEREGEAEGNPQWFPRSGQRERLQLQRVVVAQGTVTRTRGAVLRKQTALGPSFSAAAFLQTAGISEAKRTRAGKDAAGWLRVGSQPLEQTSRLISSGADRACSLAKGTTVFLEANGWGLVVCPPQGRQRWAGSSLLLPRPEKP